MSGYPCPYCAENQPTFRDARDHHKVCLANDLGFDLYQEVLSGRMPLDEARKKQAARPKLKL